MNNNRCLNIMKSGGSAIAIAFAVMPTLASAADVTLKSSDGTINITGEFLRFQNNIYTLRTPIGDVNIAGARVSCEGDICPTIETKDAEITVAGSRDLGDALTPLLIEGFASSLEATSTLTTTNQTNETFAVLTGDSGFGARIGSYLIQSSDTVDGFAKLANSQAQIAMSGRRIRPDEARDLAAAGAGNMVAPSQEHIVAVDSLVVIMHPSNPVETLSYEQLRDMYLGKITNWSEVGGPDMAVLPVSLSPDSPLQNVFDRVVLSDEDNQADRKGITVENMIGAADFVNETAGAIGFVGYSFQRGAKAATLMNECGIAERPDAFSARTEEYALQRRVYLYSREDTQSASMDAFLNYATSSSADEMVAKAGYIGMGIERRSQSGETPRAAALTAVTDRYERTFADQALEKLNDNDRLSTTFRFRTGSSRLEERGQLDLSRLVDHLAELPGNHEVMFVGFTDDVGSFQGNLALSENRASQVMSEISAIAEDRLPNITLGSIGFSELAATGCNLHDDGRRINRRVEVWIKSTT